MNQKFCYKIIKINNNKIGTKKILKLLDTFVSF